ncbi:sugar ABC transporter permease [Mesorhizobium sp. VK23B]|uniref:Sugar ABC transporter permease n=1 Tax=Mesorhizobium dulcispinae TaxID=3072316 RepID=A0ABU4XD68_9HYPH|nr:MULTISPECIES: sugar ABC transporter permease [unclassified Mesorhizobium]MDX8465709.1 sugar ABC transporter permease [Mesorhizobium sp. VK23B]MDX8471489.1 sugar ABC transporter permease [Mesorhizobium sp. VK23A]
MTMLSSPRRPRDIALREPRGLMLALPAVFLLVGIFVVPIVIVIGVSLTDYNFGDSGAGFVGLRNYREFLGDPTALQALWHSIYYTLIVAPLTLCLGLFIACLIQARERFRHFYEIIFFLPVTSTFVAMALVWQFLLHGRIGPINEWLVRLGLERIDFLTDPEYALITLSAIGVWQLVGQSTILFLAGLAAIPQDIYDAGALDGMDQGWDRFSTLTFPLITPTALFVLITTTITAFQVFDSVAALTKGGPGISTQTLLYKIYLEAYQYSNTSYAATLSVLFLAIIFTFTLFQLFVANRNVHY